MYSAFVLHKPSLTLINVFKFNINHVGYQIDIKLCKNYNVKI